ncbi:hypothetical protein ACQ4LE_006938 [Meloidogyne hapla]|uniref:ABC transmembrane type-1 domain-containing protein n=1 Tax=Meloidogyne hapla TaxID=6305 RepID=A0A1I8C0R6_MELHA
MRWIILFGRRCICDVPTSTSRLLNLSSINLRLSTSARYFSSKIPSSSSNLFTRRNETGEFITKFLSPKQLRSIFRPSLRHFGDSKRQPKLIKDLKISDVKGIAVLALPYKSRIFAGLCLLFIGSGLFLTLPRILGKMIDEFETSKNEGEEEENKQEIKSFSIIPQKEIKNKEEKEDDLLGRIARYFRHNPWTLGAVLVFAGCANGARFYLMHTTSQLIVNDLRTNVFRNILRQDMAFFDKNKVGEIVSRLSSDAYIVGTALSTNLGDGIRSIFTTFVTAGMMVYTSPDLSLLGLVVIPFIGGSFYVYGKWIGYYAIQMQEAIAGTNQLATERLSNVKTVRVFVAENKELKAYRNKISDIWDISRREGRATGFFVGGFYSIGYGFLSSLLYYGSHLISQGLLTYGDLSSFVLYAIICSGSISHIRTFYSELMRGLGASSRLFELRDTKPKIPLSGDICLTDLKEGIRFESVAFSYPDRDPIFNDVTFKIPLASTTAIVGPSGCGKSTIAHLLLRLYAPTQGRILIDGQDMKNIDPSEWRKICGVVSQEPVLFSATIRENILYGVPDGREVSNEELEEVAQLSNSLEFIRSFPQGFDTMVGEHGSSMLSGGQRQRIAIARALIKKPRFIILDEATSALDATSEYLVRKALEVLLAKSGQTVLIIAHRLSTIKHAEQIVVLEKGSVAELGCFDDLMNIKDGIFQKLVEKQSLDWRFDKF